MYQERFEQIKKLREQIAEMAGRKGVSDLRKKLFDLEAQQKRADEIRAKMKKNVQGMTISPRSPYHVERMRALIEYAQKTVVDRGEYGEIILRTPSSSEHYFSADSVASMSKHLRHHPQLSHLRGYWQAWDIINRCNDIPIPDCEFDRKGRGWAVNIDLYGYTEDGLVLVQVRRTEIRKYRNTTIRYLVTDGKTTVEITSRKALIKKAATADPRPDSPLRIIKTQLPEEWQARIGDEQIRIKTNFQPQWWTAWKIFRLYPDGKLLSVYDDTVWTLGKQRTKKAVENHGGGYYVRLCNPNEIKAAFDAGTLVRIPAGRNIEWRAALVRCKCRGKTVVYGNGKIAVSICKPVEIVEVW